MPGFNGAEIQFAVGSENFRERNMKGYTEGIGDELQEGITSLQENMEKQYCRQARVLKEETTFNEETSP